MIHWGDQDRKLRQVPNEWVIGGPHDPYSNSLLVIWKLSLTPDKFPALFPAPPHHLGWRWCVHSLMLQVTLELQRLVVDYNHMYVFQGLCFMNMVGEKGQKHRTMLDISGSQVIVSWVSATRLQNQGLMLFTNHLWRRNRGTSFWVESSVVNGHGNHTGQDESRVITCFFALSVPWCFYTWEQVHGDSQDIGGASGTWFSCW